MSGCTPHHGKGWDGLQAHLWGSEGWAAAGNGVLTPRSPGHLLVWHGTHLPGGLQGEAQGAQEEPVWERQLLLAGLQILLQR